MFNFGLDFSHLLVNGIPTNNQLHQALIRAQSMPFEQKSGFSSAFEPVFQFQQPGANTHEFCRFLETFFNCVLKSRGKVDVPQRSIGASNGILWPPKTLSPPPTTAPAAQPQPPVLSASSSSSQLPSPSLSVPRKPALNGEEAREQTSKTINQGKFATPALNSLIEMTLSKTYQLGNANEMAKGKYTFYELFKSDF